MNLELAKPRGVYPDATSAAAAARYLRRSFVISTGTYTHTVYEAAWQPLVHDQLAVDLEPTDRGWTISLADHQNTLLLDSDDTHWLQATALPAALALINQLTSEHQARQRDLRWPRAPKARATR